MFIFVFHLKNKNTDQTRSGKLTADMQTTGSVPMRTPQRERKDKPVSLTSVPRPSTSRVDGNEILQANSNRSKFLNDFIFI